jgi:hypothetical protein
VAEAIPDYNFTLHALRQIRRRRLTLDLVHQVMRDPEQRFPITIRRDILQKRAMIGGAQYLVRVVVDVGTKPPEVVTAYKTSKIPKYWRTDS